MRILLILLLFSNISFGQRGAAFAKDPDAQIFIMRGDFQSNTNNYAFDFSSARQNGAWSGSIDQLCKDYKRFGLWEKERVIYPCFNVGEGTVGNSLLGNGGGMGFLRHRLNLKGSAHDMIAVSGFQVPGSSLNGTTFGTNANGATANTVLNTNFPQNFNNSFVNTSLAIYSMTNNAVSGAEIGVYNNSSYQQISYLGVKMASGVSSTLLGYNHPTNANGEINATVGDSRGLFTATRSSLTDFKFYQNSTLLATNTSQLLYNAPQNRPYFAGALNYTGTATNTPNFYTNRTVGFITIGENYTPSELAIKKQIIDAFFTSIGRPTF